jgi:hypothetical protein
LNVALAAFALDYLRMPPVAKIAASRWSEIETPDHRQLAKDVRAGRQHRRRRARPPNGPPAMIVHLHMLARPIVLGSLIGIVVGIVMPWLLG